MIDALINGKLASKPIKRYGKDNKPFLTVGVFTPIADGDSIRISVIAFDANICAALFALDIGESVCLSGELTPKLWQPKDGGDVKISCDFVAHAVLTTYHVKRKRQVM